MGSTEERLQGQGLGIYRQQLSDNLSMFIKRRSAYCGIGKGMSGRASAANTLLGFKLGSCVEMSELFI